MLKSDRIFLAIGPFSWGRGATPEEAVRGVVKNLSGYENKQFKVVLLDAPAGARVSNDGFISWDDPGAEEPCILIESQAARTTAVRRVAEAYRATLN